MSTRWLSVAEAASVLGVSERTVRRRISRNQLDWRRGPNGRKEVCLDVEDGVLEVEREPSGAAEDPGWTPPRLGEKFGRYSPLAAEEVGTFDSEPAKPGGGPPSRWLRAEAVADEKDADAEGEADEATAEAHDESGSMPRLTPKQLFGGSAEDDGDDLMTRMNRLAGASVMLAQRASDEANEKVRLARNEAYRMRQWCYRSWIAAAALMLLCLLVVSSAGGPEEASADPGEAGTSAQVEKQVEKLRHEIAALRRAVAGDAEQAKRLEPGELPPIPPQFR
ncbi:MAG: helix-turn-helix domain-containing protein [Phycisphaeraceae bacterium]